MMRAFSFGRLFCYASVAVTAMLGVSPVQAAGTSQSTIHDPRSTSGEPRSPLIEVVAFGAAPVSGVIENNELLPKPGDVIYRSQDRGAGQRQQHEVETRAIFGESWRDLLNRVADRLGPEPPDTSAITSRVDLLPVLQAGKYVRVRPLSGSRSIEIDYVLTPEEAYSIVLDPAGVQVRRHAADPRLIERMRSDASKASLFTATDAIGLPEDLVLQLVDIFSDDVDFFRELHRGYRSTLVYEMLYRDGYIDRPGRILAAEFVIRNRRLQAFYFDDGTGRAGYYTETGKSMKKAFRRSPVEFSRLTSGYTLARFHPILGLWRAHRGTDYAAPEGARVLATADGVVDFVGERGELGNLVILRHYDRYLTYYGHLNGFVGGLAVGGKVEKGQVIGYVGMTGLATGPHVHFEFHVRNASGQWVSVPVPEVLEAPPVESRSFFEAIQTYRNQLQVAKTAHFVTLD